MVYAEPINLFLFLLLSAYVSPFQVHLKNMPDILSNAFFQKANGPKHPKLLLSLTLLNMHSVI